MQSVVETRCLTMLNQNGDTSIEWDASEDDAMRALIARKMALGVTFYVIAPRKSTRGRAPKPKVAKDVDAAMKHRALSIPDADFCKFVLDGHGRCVQTPTEPARTIKRAKTADEVASGHAVGVAPRRGG